ncbi:hypothetical protein [Pseudomonas solani]
MSGSESPRKAGALRMTRCSVSWLGTSVDCSIK